MTTCLNIATRNVALRKESVDRNRLFRTWVFRSPHVALRKESVDRNFVIGFIAKAANSSLSARRAWIEIRIGGAKTMAVYVALRKESVDRNCELPSKAGEFRMSLSARRAWIEILRQL